MGTGNREELLQFYRDELNYLRRMGREFKSQYAKLAARLEISDNECSDPHVERLIQSFAFLTARLQLNLRDEFPEITSALLGALYPQLINPIPAMGIAQFRIDPTQGKTTTGSEIPRETRLFYDTPQKLTCRFRTCYPVTVWPLKVVAAGLEDPGQVNFLSTETNVAAVLRLELGCLQESTFKELEMKHLRFFLNGDAITVNTLYELLFTRIMKIAILPEGRENPIYLPLDSIKPVGFGVEEEVLPYPRNAHPAYRLVQEYFSFPAKYHFFDLYNLNEHGSGKKLEIFFLLNERPARNPAITPETFSLGCTPVINLFHKTTEPIRLDHKSFEYPLIPDKRRESTTEIHSILSVSASSDPYKSAAELKPFYSYDHYMDGFKHRAFWHAIRRNSNRREVPGTEMSLSFLDLNFKPADPPVQTVYAHTLCTNRELTITMRENAPLKLEEALLEYDITLLGRPSLPYSPMIGGPTAWRLVSHLSLNHLSLSEGSDSLNALREILGLYCVSNRPSVLNQIAGITQMEIAKKSMYMGDGAWQGFCRGTGITLTFDEDMYRGSGAFLLGAVLNSFFGLYTAVNSFTQLTIKKLSQPEMIWKQWEPRAGDDSLKSAVSEGTWKQWEPMAGEKIIL
ncbi:MAG TPA: type VI secretion system baseplate subunit TssF [Pyrinomonadaceae bacterium]|nr:type VI secretion system baseplate subunit TssF [Pyrinomonadaceae bacterium]